MQIQITGLHDLELTEPLKEYVHKKMGTLKKNLEAFEKKSPNKNGTPNGHFTSTTDIHITLSVERVDKKMQHKAKAVVHLPRKSLTAEAVSENMYSSIDQLVPPIKTQLKHLKENFQDRTTGLLPHEHE